MQPCAAVAKRDAGAATPAKQSLSFLFRMCYVNNNLGNINSRLDTSLSSSVLDYALTLPEGMHTVRFPGDSYTGADTPNSYYRYSGATIIVRSKGKVVTVLLYGISTKALSLIHI